MANFEPILETLSDQEIWISECDLPTILLTRKKLAQENVIFRVFLQCSKEKKSGPYLTEKQF